jgi:RNA polymerase sigma-70 factor (ECF subfamily)
VQVKTVDDLAAVVRRAQQLDAEAFEWLVDAYSSRLYGFLYRLTGRSEDAEELVQDVFVRLVRAIRSYEHDGRFEAWLFRIATNLARDRIRRRIRAPEICSLEALEERPNRRSDWERLGDLSGPSPEAATELAEDLGRLEHCLARLASPEREVILLRHYARLSFAEIAEAMSTPVGTALARSHRGLAKLRRWMESSE